MNIEINDLEESSDDDLYYDEDVYNPNEFTHLKCSVCGKELRRHEHEEFEDTCEGCITELTAGILLDDPYKEL